MRFPKFIALSATLLLRTAHRHGGNSETPRTHGGGGGERGPPDSKGVEGQEEDNLDVEVEAAVVRWKEARGTGQGGDRRGGRCGATTLVTTARYSTRRYVISLALRLFDACSESNTAYIVFSDSTAAMSRAQTDRTGPGQAFLELYRGRREAGKPCGLLDHLTMNNGPQGS